MQNIKLLIVDDEQDVRQKLADSFSAIDDFEVVACAKDGLDAIAKAETLLPDAIVLDLVMPYLDGFGVLANLDFTKFKKRPTIVVASNLRGELFSTRRFRRARTIIC